MMKMLSIIIPTQNRATYLEKALLSLLSACVPMIEEVECLVIDNGSTDSTPEVVMSFAASAPFPVRYIYAPCPGLHVGRNLGAQLANAELLAYLDDDVIVQEGWAQAIIARFNSDNRIALVGGPCRPLWEAPPPDWVLAFQQKLLDGWYLGELSLIDQGSYSQPTTGSFVFGCNFSIRKSVLFQAGGFHPDGMPSHLLQYRGDGESYVAEIVGMDSSLIAFYESAAAIMHTVPVSRLTPAYFQSIAKRNGIGGAYALFRNAHNNSPLALLKRTCKLAINFLTTNGRFLLKRLLRRKIRLYYYTSLEHHAISTQWQLYHFVRIICSPHLQKWVKMPRYFEDTNSYYWKG